MKDEGRTGEKTMKAGLKILLGVVFVAAGCLHFLKPEPYVKIMPPMLPFPLMLVYLSGAAEMVLGAAMFTRFAPWAAWGLIALLVAVFPANIHMALHPELTPKLPEWTLWARLPFQGVFIAWAYWYAA